MTKRFPVLLIACLMCFNLAHAQDTRGPDVVTVKLKNRGKIEGVIVSETEKGIVVDVGFGTVAVSREDITDIESPLSEEKDHMVKTWRGRRADTQKNIKYREREQQAVEKRIEEGVMVKEEIAHRAKREEGYRIKFSDRSRIVAEVVLNDEITTTLLVDTGATAVVIPIDIANQLTDVKLDPSRKIEAKLADGTIREGFPVMLRSVEVGDMKATDVEAVAMDLKGKYGLLGMSYLNRFYLSLDIENDELVIREK